MLEQAFQTKWPDPALASNVEEFHKQYTELYGVAKAYKEIHAILENAAVMAQNLAKQISDPKRDYSLGTDDTTTPNKGR